MYGPMESYDSNYHTCGAHYDATDSNADRPPKILLFPPSIVKNFAHQIYYKSVKFIYGFITN